MLKIATIAALALATVAVAAGSQPVALDVGCETKQDLDKYRACTADCKKTSDKAQKACNDAYRGCRAKCTGADKKTCRAECRTAYRDCSSRQRTAHKKCRSDCLEDSGCEQIPGAPN